MLEKYLIDKNYQIIIDQLQKNKNVPKVVKKEITLLQKEIAQNIENLKKANNFDYNQFLDSDLEIEQIEQFVNNDNISKLIFFVKNLSFYLEMSMIIVEMKKLINLNIDILNLNQIIKGLEDIIPSLVNVFSDIDKNLDNIVEYEALKEKMFNFDEQLNKLSIMLIK